MIDLNTNHLAFDMSMELLCLLPRGDRKEDGAALDGLARDLGLSRGPKEARAYSYKLHKHDDLMVYSRKKVKRMAINPAGWDKASRDGQLYWIKVYGVPQATRTMRLVR